MESSSNLKNYSKAISDFENFLKDIYSSNTSGENEYIGYLINLKDYEKIKEIVNDVNINDYEINFTINQIEIKTPQYLTYMILNENKYIFINTELWRIICNEDKINDTPIKYKINENDITFSLDKIEFSFNLNNNIIDKNSLNSNSIYKSNYEKITKIYDSINNYYKFEKAILKDLKNKKNSRDKNNEYLIDKKWIEKWETISNYEKIKNNFAQDNLNSKKNIMNILIYYLEQNKCNYNELFESVNIRKFNKIEEFESYLNKNSLVLVNGNFINRFDNFFSFLNFFKSIKYKAFNNRIHFYLDDNEILSFKSNNNIISLNEIINYPNLKQLIKIFFFQKKLKSNIRDKCNKNIYLINKKVISIYKTYFNYKKLYDFLKSNSNLKKINNDNFLEDNYYYIINNLDDDYISQFVNFEQNKMLEKFKDVNNENFIELEYKINSVSDKYLKYISNFELVDNEIKDFFIKNNIAKEEHFISLHSYICRKRKILVIFDKDNNNFYEVGHFNNNEDFIIEYLIDELENISKEDIGDYFLDNGIDSFINDPKESQNIINCNKWWTNRKFIYYKLEKKENPKELINNQTPICKNINNIDNNVDIIDNKFIKDIFFILSSIFIFEKNILKNSIQQSYKKDYILLSKQFLIDFKKFFSYDKIYSILEQLNVSSNDDIEETLRKFSEDIEKENILRLIFNKEKEFEKNKSKNKEYFIFEKKELIINSQKNLLYPDKFCILDENLYSQINKLLNMNIESIEEIKFELSFNPDRLALKPKSFSKFNNQYYILICPIINNEAMKDINYIPEIILSFDNFEKMNNSFKEMIKNEK